MNSLTKQIEININKTVSPKIASNYQYYVNNTRRRQLQYEQVVLSAYLTRLKDFITQCDKGERELLTMHLNSLLVQRKLPWGYGTNAVDLNFDRVNEVRKTGVAISRRKYYVLYSLEDSLDAILATIFSEDKDMIRQALTSNAKEVDIEYLTLSRAVLCQDEYFLNKINLGMFCDITPALDACLCKLDTVGDDLVIPGYNDNQINLGSIEFSSKEEKVSTMFYSLILHYLHYLTECLVVTAYHNLYKRNPGQVVLDSIGLGNILIHSNIPIEDEIKLNFYWGTETLVPMVFEQNVYTQLFNTYRR